MLRYGGMSHNDPKWHPVGTQKVRPMTNEEQLVKRRPINKTLTIAAIAKINPGSDRKEIPDGGCRGLYLVIEPTGQKSWYVKTRVHGSPRRRRLKLGPVDVANLSTETGIGKHLTLKSARALAPGIIDELRGGHTIARRVSIGGATGAFPTVAREFVEKYLRDRNKKNGQLRRTWWKVARALGFDYSKKEPTVIPGSLCDRWAGRPVAGFTRADVREVIDEARLKGIPGRKPKNADPSMSRERELRNALSQIFDWAMRHRDMIEVNPCATLPEAESGMARDRVLTDAELRAVWLAMDELKIDSRVAGIWRVMMLTGARLGEVTEMSWDELDDKLTTWTIPGTRTKNGENHVVHITPAVRNIIKSFARNFVLVFATANGKPMTAFGKPKSRIDAKLNLKPWRTHDFRRTMATGLQRLGVPVTVTEAVLNHKSGTRAGIVGIYQRHDYADEKRGALDRWAAHVAGVIAGRKSNVVQIRA